ncbi:sulfatase [Granulicella cerasi]|uniref:Sulfatase n=1 Tax=Granulicella cerasi TaxID=741063 RepID=A0ABW1ZBV8_9BACT|nr:sulfatase [Granulicella cerasi]
MDRREFLVGAAASGLSAASLSARAATSKKRKPNLVYVFADQLRYSSCGYAGDALAHTPNMDKLAAEGASYRQAVSSTPVCAPYRASLMTGKYQSSTGMVINEMRLSPEHECFGHVLTRGGYQTAYIGKWHLWGAQLGHHDLIRNGFTPPGKYRLGFDGYWAAYNFNHSYNHSPYFLNDTTPHIREQYEPDAQTDVAIEYLKSHRRDDEPFALFLSWGPPHSPWGPSNNAPKEFAELFAGKQIPLAPNYSTISDPYSDNWQKIGPAYDQRIHEWMRVYYSQVANLDWNLGRLMKALDDAKLTEDTIFVFTSDHGEMFGAHGRQGKLIFYEEAARVPFLVRWPRKIRPKTVTDALLGTPDIMPTILTMLGLPTPQAVEGQDLSGHVTGKPVKHVEAAHLQGMGATAAWADGSEWRAARTEEFTYAIYRKDGRELLFNHAKDPYQLEDLAGDKSYAATLAHLRETSVKWRKEQNDEFHNCQWYESRWTHDRNITSTAKGVGQNLDELDALLHRWFPGDVGDRSVGVPVLA